MMPFSGSTLISTKQRFRDEAYERVAANYPEGTQICYRCKRPGHNTYECIFEGNAFYANRRVPARVATHSASPLRTITMEGVRDVQGKVVSAPFYLEPIDLNHSTLIVGRTTRNLLTFYRALLERGYPVVMHGIPDTARELMDCLSEMNQNNVPLEYVRERLDLAIDAQSGIAAPASHSYEQVTALKGLLEIYLEEDSDVNTSLPESSHAFSKWIDKFFKPGEAEKGVVRLTTAHAGKGLEADDVFIVNPSMFPLQERIDLGGWAEFEELCVEYVAKSRARDRMVYLPDLEVSSKDEVFRLLDKPN